MKQFFSTALGAFVGALLAMFVSGVLSVILSLIFFIGFAGAFSSQEVPEIKENSILEIELKGPISDRAEIDTDIMSLVKNEAKSTSLSEIIKSIDLAAEDSRIKGIYIKNDEVFCGPASSYEIRKALSDFKKSGKWIYSYGDFYAQSAYYISSIADSIFVNNEGIVQLSGLSSATPYFKGLLDKLGIEMQVFKVGTFKSAVEPFILTESSEANKLQQLDYLGTIWNVIAQEIATSRKISKEKVNVIVDSITFTQPVDYLIANKLVDKKIYGFNMEKVLKTKLGITEDDDINFVSPSDVVASASNEDKSDKIAVLYAEGEINASSKKGIVADDMIENILDAAKDDDIKGLVMRVNSPGGSSFDSEQIWAALEEFKKTGKPFAVSMGDYAASGGYYISCGADRIFAEPVTITGSIGIFGIVPNFSKLSSNIGVNFSEVSTNQNGNFPSVIKPMTPMQAQAFQASVNRGYELFTSRCANGRHMPIDSLKAIAEGRVWAGESALRLKLVDQMGGINDAVKWVASKAKINDYSLLEMPKQKELWEKILDEYIDKKISAVFSNEFDAVFNQKELVMKLVKIHPIQARADIEVNF